MSGTSFDPAAEAAELRTRLVGMGDRPVKGEAKTHLRVATPNLRRLARSRRDVIGSADSAEAEDLAERLWSGESYDEMHMAVEVLHLRPDLVGRDLILRWADDLDHWGITDSFATVVRSWVAAEPDRRYQVLDTLAADEDVWRRRLGIVSTVLLSRRGRELDRTFALIDSVIDDRRQKIVNAVSWALREMVNAAPDRVATYVEDRADDIPARVRLEVWNKLRTGRKDGKKRPRGTRGEAARARFEVARQAVAERRAAKDRKPPGRRRKQR